MVHGLIMAGGKGTRFWPLSREKKAKQFLSIVSDKSLIELTIDRLATCIKEENLWIIGNNNQSEAMTQHKSVVPNNQILLEPFGRNTAPCIGWATLEILKKDPEAIIVTCPADHIIKETDHFNLLIELAITEINRTNSLITIGITPTHAHTGYGYIEAESSENTIKQVEAFHEKPDHATAQTYLTKGNYYWNSGIFVWKASRILELMEELMPRNYEALVKLPDLNKSAPNYMDELSKVYNTLTSISIDFGIMEHASQFTKVIPSTFTWSDIGNWTSLDDFLEKDDNGNAIKNAKCLAINSKNNIIYSNKLVGLIDINDLLVVETDDAILVMPKTSDQKIKELYEQLPKDYL